MSLHYNLSPAVKIYCRHWHMKSCSASQKDYWVVWIVLCRNFRRSISTRWSRKWQNSRSISTFRCISATSAYDSFRYLIHSVVLSVTNIQDILYRGRNIGKFMTLMAWAVISSDEHYASYNVAVAYQTKVLSIILSAVQVNVPNFHVGNPSLIPSKMSLVVSEESRTKMFPVCTKRSSNLET